MIDQPPALTSTAPIQTISPLVATAITFTGGKDVTITINQKTGEVVITGSGTLPDAAKAFWEAVQRSFPGCKQ